jgi:hypothetical protein
VSLSELPPTLDHLRLPPLRDLGQLECLRLASHVGHSREEKRKLPDDFETRPYPNMSRGRNPYYQPREPNPYDFAEIFTKLNTHWTRLVQRYGMQAAERWFSRRTSDHALYLAIFNPKLDRWAHTTAEHPNLLPSPRDSRWYPYLCNNPGLLLQWARSHGYILDEEYYEQA